MPNLYDFRDPLPPNTLQCVKTRQGVPWDHIMENEFEYLFDRGDHGGHLKKYCSYLELSRLPYRDLLWLP